MNTAGKLQDKVAIAAGAAAGIGRASSLLFAQEGAWVAAVDRDSVHNAKVVEEIRAGGGTARALNMNFI